MNDQRKVIYEQRRDLMDADDVSETIQDMRENTIDKMVGKCMPEKAYTEQWDIKLLHEELMRIFGLDLPVADWAKEEGVADAEVHERISDAARRKMAEKAATWTPDVMRDVEKSLLLQVLDQIWKDHLLALDHLRQGIGLRSYAQRDPLNEYKGEAFEMFNAMLEELDERITLILAHIQLQIDGLDNMDLFARSDQPTMEVYEDPAFSNGGGILEDGSDYGNAVAPVVSRQSAEHLDPEDPTTWGKVGRNSACPCGSGKKYKHCHGVH
jgi:preprotein translocase subunit SecA